MKHKKTYTVMILSLLLFGLFNPFFSAINIYAEEVNSNFDITLDSEKNITDYLFNSHKIDVEINYSTNETTYDKQIKVSLPASLQVYVEPLVDGENISDYQVTYNGDGSQDLYITIPAGSNGAYQSLDFEISFDALSASSNEIYLVDAELYELDKDGNANQDNIKTSSATIQTHDFTTDGYIDIISNVSSNRYLDTAVTLNHYLSLQGSYNQNASISSYLQFKYTDASLDLTKMKYTLPNGSEQYIGDKIDYIDVKTTSDQNYDSDSGILTFDDTTVMTLSTDLIFSSDFFEEGTKINTNYEESFDYKILEYNGKDITNLVNESSSTFELSESRNNLEIEIESGVHNSTILSNQDYSKIFKVKIEDMTNDFKNVNFTIDIPEGVVIDKISNASQIKLYDEDKNQVSGTSGEYDFILDEKLEGPQTITVNIDELDSTETKYKYNGITFFGSVNSDLGTQYNFVLDNYVKADLYTSNDELSDSQIAVMDIDDSNNEVNISVVDKTILDLYADSPSIVLEGRPFNAGKVSPGDVVQVISGVNLRDYSYAATYDYIDPIIYMNLPKELLPEGGTFDKSDFSIIENGTKIDYTNSITDIEVIDEDVSLPNGEGTKLVVIRLDGETISGIPEEDVQPDITFSFNAIVDPQVNETTDITFNNYSFAFSSTNTDAYESVAGFNLTGDESKVYNLDLSVENSIAGTYINNTNEITVPKAIKGYSLVDTNNSGYFYTVGDSDSLDSYPEYYMGTDGTFKFVQDNTTDETQNDLNSYFVLPQEENLEFILDASAVVDNPKLEVYYTSEEITDTSKWTEGEFNVTWTKTAPASGNITAVRLVSNSIDSGEQQAIEIPFTTKYLQNEDSITYDNKIEAQTSYNISSSIVDNGKRGSITIVKSNAPTIELKQNIDGDSYIYKDEDFLNKLFDYEVTDDISDELLDSEGLEGNSDDMDNVVIVYSSNDGFQKTYNKSEFIDLKQYNPGVYEVTYTSEKDADAQQGIKTISYEITSENASISADDASIDYDDAPQSDLSLLSSMNVKAKDFDEVDLINDVKVNTGEYNYENPKMGTYEITFKVTGKSGKEVAVTKELEITASDAKLNASSVVVSYSDVPKDDEQLLLKLGVKAYDYNNEDITSNVKIESYGLFSYNNYTTSTYTIDLKVTGANKNVTYKTVELTISDEDKMLIGKDCMVDIAEKPAPTTVEEIKDEMKVQAMEIDESDITDKVKIMDMDGYDMDDPQVGSYDMEFHVDYMNETDETIMLTLTVFASDAHLSVNDITVEYDQAPETINEVRDLFQTKGDLVHKDCTGEDLGDDLVITNIDNLDFNTQIISGDYKFLFEITGASGDTVSKTAVLRINPGESIITASDATVEYSDAPQTDLELIDALKASAVNYLGEDISSELIVTDYDGYSFTNTQSKTYSITYDTTDGLAMPITVSLTVLENPNKEEIVETGINNYSIIVAVLAALIAITIILKKKNK